MADDIREKGGVNQGAAQVPHVRLGRAKPKECRREESRDSSHWMERQRYTLKEQKGLGLLATSMVCL
jgi:hypothetical protein